MALMSWSSTPHLSTQGVAPQYVINDMICHAGKLRLA